MYFNKESIKFPNCDTSEEIEISFVIISDNVKRFSPLTIKLKDLPITQKDTDEIWTLPNQSFINVTYNIQLKKEDIKSNKTPIKKNAFLSFFSGHKTSIRTTPPKNKSNAKGTQGKFFFNTNTASAPSKVSIYSPHEISSNSTNISPCESYEIIETNSTSAITNPNFCEAIFISTLSPKVKNSNEKTVFHPAPCGHSECSLFPSYPPSVTLLYKNKDFDACDIKNGVVACMAFPLGIKMCYKCKFGKTVENAPKPYNIFYNTINNEKGESFYVVTLHYFRKVSSKKFSTDFQINPLKEFGSISHSLEVSSDKHMNNFTALSQSILNDSLLIPESVSLLSRYPYLTQMEICLKNIIAISRDETIPLISHLINEVKIPPRDTSMLFYLPRTVTPITIQSPLSPDRHISNLSGINYEIIFSHFTVQKIIYIFQLLILEQKLIFIGNDYRLLSQISYSFLMLMSPLEWAGAYIPVLSLSTVQFVQSIVPYVMGLDENLLNYACEMGYLNKDDDEINLIYIDSSKKIKHNKNLTELPKVIEEYLTYELKKYKPSSGNEKLSKIFLTAIIMLISEFKQKVFYSNCEDIFYFDKEGYVSLFRGENNKEGKTCKFIRDVISTQNFSQFLMKMKQFFFDEDYWLNKEIFEFNIENDKKASKKRSRNLSLVKQRGSSKTRDMSSTNDSNITNIMKKKNSVNFGRTFNENNTGFLSNDTKGEIFSQSKNDCLSLLSNAPEKKPQIEHQVTNEKKYLLFPYFVSVFETRLDKAKIEDCIRNSLAKKKLYDVLNNEEHCYIFPETSNKFTNIEHIDSVIKPKKYKIPCDKDISEFNVCDTKSTSSKATIKKELGEKDHRTLLEFFNKLMIKKVITINDDYTKQIINRYFSGINIYKEYFSQMIIYNTQIYYSDSFLKSIDESTYEILLHICITALNSPSIKEITCKGYTIALVTYYKNALIKRVQSNHFLYQDAVQSIRCDLWQNLSFWRFFTDDEINRSKSSYSVSHIIEKIADIMKKIKLSNNLITQCFLSEYTMTLVDSSETEYENIEKYIQAIINEF